MTDALPLAGRVALVTGASRGLGRAVALEIARRGAHVVAVARTVGGLEELDDQIKALGGAATLVPMDLKDAPAIDRLGAALFERWGRLDALVGNAGVLGALTPITHLQPKVWDELLQVNLTANWRLIRSLDPLLLASEAGRVVLVTSGAARKHTPFWGGYAATKAALESLALTYAAERDITKIRVNIFNPGPVRTAMRAKAFPGEDPMSLPPTEIVAPKIVDMLMPEFTQNGTLVNFKAS